MSNFRHAWPAIIALGAACFRLASYDVPLALAWGRTIAERKALPATNVLSHVHHEYPVQLDKWLFQLGLYLAHAAGGPAALVLLRVALLLATLWAAAKAARLQWHRTSHALLGVLFTIALMNRVYMRAELITWLAIPLMVCLIPMLASGKGRGWVLLVLLQAVWANAHGYWVVGPLLLVAAATGAVLQPCLAKARIGALCRPRPVKERLRLLAAVPVALASACLTPYGAKTLVQPVRLAMELRYAQVLTQTVDDFGTPLDAIRRGGSIPFWACCAMGLLGIAATLLLARRRKLDGETLAVFGLGLLLSLPYYRNCTMLALCALPLCTTAIEIARPGPMRSPRRGRYAVAAAPALIWLALAFSGWGPACDYGRRMPGFGWRTTRYPIDAADWIAQNAPDAKLWNDFDSGGWLSWRLGEGHTYIDGNTDGYPLSFLSQYHRKWGGARTEPWFPTRGERMVALVNYEGNGFRLAQFLNGISWIESPAFGFADRRYCVVFADADAPGTDPRLTAAVWRYVAQRVTTGPLAQGYSLKALSATPPNAPLDMYVRSGRLAIRLYPNEPAAWAHYHRTCGTAR